MKVIVTRPRDQAGPLVARLEARSHEVVECPLIEIERKSDDPVDGSGYDWIIITSPNGADEIARRGRNLPKIAAVGPGTAERLREHGLRPAFVPRLGAQPEEVFARIHEAGGIASLAHPGLLGHDKWIAGFASAGLDAVEAYHPEHDPASTLRYLGLAERLGLAVSGGSDYHAGPTHGAAGPGGVVLPLERYEKLKSRRRN